MKCPTTTPVTSQRKYYSETAEEYDDIHPLDSRDFQLSISELSRLLKEIRIESILDVGCGTGREIARVLEMNRETRVLGIEPVRNMIDVAIRRNSIPRESLICGVGEFLPFDDCSFDATCEFGVLHHIRDPSLVLKEMLRVSKKAVFLHDSNFYATGPLPWKLLKYATKKMGLWRYMLAFITQGKCYHESLEDGISYYYSVFDSLKILDDWSDTIFIVPTSSVGNGKGFGRTLNCPTILLCAVRSPL